MRLAAALLLLTLPACTKTEDNPATRYVDTLHSDVQGANRAAEVATQKNADVEKEARKALE